MAIPALNCHLYTSKWQENKQYDKFPVSYRQGRNLPVSYPTLATLVLIETYCTTMRLEVLVGLLMGLVLANEAELVS